jgi:hypothetical protein
LNIRYLLLLKQATIFVILLFCLFSGSVQSQVTPLPNAHAHNDYKHKHPLSDAMHCGFTGFEADIFLRNGNLIVAHAFPAFSHKTLEELYFKPLYDSITKYKGCAYYLYPKPVILLIDIKTEAVQTYEVLKPLLEKYAPILTYAEDGKVHERAITVILSGNKPYEAVKNEIFRLAFIDEGLLTIADSKYDNSMCPLTSTRYSNVLSWNGKGDPDKAEEEALLKLIASAHKQGKKIRLWASPENEKVWKKLLEYGVDLINTDELEELKAFLELSGKKL